MEEVLILDDRPSPTNNNDSEREPRYSTLEHHQGPPLPNHQPANENELVGNSPQKPRGQTPYTITICISKGNQGYGFSVKWTKPPRVERVEPGLAADRAGLRAGDYIIFIGEHNVVKYDENAVLQIIRECGETLIMEVYRRGITKVPRGLANGYANRASVSESTAFNEAHPRKRLSHITFNSEAGEQDRQNIIYNLINCEQAFSNACRFGLERYFIPLKFRTDLITQAQHSQLFSNMDQLVDMSDSVVDRLMGNDDDDGIGDNVGFVYYQMVDEMAENYSKYFSGLPEADKLLSHKLHEIDFKDFLLTPQIPRKKPDITTFIHKPAEHMRELVGFLTKLYSSSPGHKDNTYLDTVLDRLKACYRGMTSQQNIMEPTPPMSPTGVAGNVLRPPLVSVSDIEQRLVFTKYTQPFRLHDNRRQWVFGGELYKFEGRNLKQYWVMLFTDLLLFTKINRDRVIFVMEDPVPLTAVLHALFTVKKKATEFRLIIDAIVKVPGATNSYMTLPRTQRAARKKKNHHTVTLGRENKRTLVLRAPTLELKATWSNLIQRQLYVCQQMPSPPTLYGESAPSLGRAVSTDGLHSPPAVGAGRFSCSVGDLRPDGETEEVVELNDVRPKPAQRLVFKSSKLIGTNRRERTEEIELGFEDGPETEEHLLSHQGRTAIPSSNGNPVANHRQASSEGQEDLIINIQDEGRQSYSSSAGRYGKSKSSKVKQKGGRSRKGGKRFSRGGGGDGGGGGYAEEVVLKMSDEPPHLISQGNNDPSRMNCALYNRSDSQESVLDIVVTRNDDSAAINGNYPVNDDEDEDEFVIEDIKTGVQTYLDPKKKGIRSKVKDKLFPNRHLPKAKKIDRAKKVEQFVDSIMIEDLNRGGRVTPIFDREEYLTHDDFTQKRYTLLQNHPKNFIEGDTEIITLDFPTTSSLSPQRAGLAMEEERRQLIMKRKENKKKGLTLEGIEEESPDHCSSVQKPIISPEAYEDYIGESVENDYPELAGGSDFQKDQYDDELFAQREQELYEEEQRRRQREQEEYELQLKEEELRQQQEEEERLQEMLKQQQEEELRLQEEQQQLQWQQQQELEEQKPTGPLSGSASMSFMDDHSPTSMADSQRLKRYGSSCDIAQFGVYGESTSNYGRHNDFNANAESYNCKSKVGGTGSGAFVADKLAVFERVVEEEHRKFIECQEVRKRIFRHPKKSGEYLDKFYSPQVIENIDARASVRSRKLLYYDEVFDSDDNPRSPSPNRARSPPSRTLSPPKSNTAASPSGYRVPVPEPPSFSPQPRSHVIYSNSSEPSEPARSPSPLPAEDDYDYDVYGYLGNIPQSSSPGPAYGSNATRQCSPDPQSQAAKMYPTSSRVTSPGPSSSALQVDRVSSLDEQTDEVMEMLDNSYLGMNDLDTVNGPTTGKLENMSRSSSYDALNKNAPSSSSMDARDPLDDVFEIEDYDNMGSPTAVGRGGHKRKAAPAPPPPNNASSPSSTSTSENKLGGFFNRVRKDKEKDKVGDMGRMKKTKDKKENKDKEKPAGKRFQLFGGAKKANESSTAEGAEENSPKKDKDDKGKRRLFGRGKENFLGRSPNISHKSDQQAARMTGGSFNQDSVDLDDETEFL